MRFLTWLSMIALLLTQAACNTTRGVGEDIEAAGEAVSETAQETEEELED